MLLELKDADTHVADGGEGGPVLCDLFFFLFDDFPTIHQPQNSSPSSSRVIEHFFGRVPYSVPSTRGHRGGLGILGDAEADYWHAAAEPVQLAHS